MVVRSFGVGLLTALALVVCAAPATAAPAGAPVRAAAKKCPPAQGEIVVQRRGRKLLIGPAGRGRRVCVPVVKERTPGASYLADRRRFTKRLIRPRGLSRRLLRASRRDEAFATARMRRLLDPEAARAAREVQLTIEPRREAEPGKWTSGRFERTLPDPDEVGGGQEATALAEMDAAVADKATRRGEAELSQYERYGSAAFAKQCPDADGRVAIEHTYVLRSVSTTDTRTVTASQGMHVEYTARGTATVGDDGRARDFTYRFDARMEHFASAIGRRGDRTRWTRRLPARLTFNDERVPVQGADTVRVKGAWTVGSGRAAAGSESLLAALAAGWIADSRRALRRVIKEAEQDWYERRLCVELKVRPESGADFVRGGSEAVEAEVVAKADGRPVQGGTVRVFASCGSSTPGTGPAPVLRVALRDDGTWGQQPPCVVFSAITRRGQAPDASHEWPKPPVEEFPLRYEVLDASFEEDTAASQPGEMCGEFGGTSGSKRVAGAFAAGIASQVDEHGDGLLTGRLEGRVSTTTSDHRLKGCRSTDDGLVPCETTMPGRSGAQIVRAHVNAASRSAPTATLSWSVNMPDIGFVDAGDPECNVYILGFLPNEVMRQEVPLERLKAKGPQTFEFSGTHRLTEDAWGAPATIDQTWTMKLTVRRVDANGRPL